MKLLCSFVTVFLLASIAQAQTPEVDLGTLTGVVDWAQNPQSMGDSHPLSSTGAATNNLISTSASTSYGNGASSAKAAGKVGLLKAYSSAAYNYVIRTGTEGGYSSSGAQVDITDYFTVTSSTLPINTLTTLNFSYVISGSVNVPYADQARPGISAFAHGYLRASSLEDDQEKSFDFPTNPLSSMAVSVQAKVGETFMVRYGLQTGAYLQSDIPDYRFVDADFYDTVHIYATAAPGAGFTTASGFDYLAAAAPEPISALYLIPALVGGILIRRRCIA